VHLFAFYYKNKEIEFYYTWTHK